MKHLFITSMTALAIAAPAVADNVQPNIAVGTNPAACNESVLETTSGTSNLEANWNANTLYLSWSVDGQPYATNDSNAASCTYDRGITIPTNPTKTGYTFAGWRVVTAAPAQTLFDLSTLSVGTHGDTYDADNNGINCIIDGISSSAACNPLSEANNTWGVPFSDHAYALFGEASCNTLSNAAAEYLQRNIIKLLTGQISGEQFMYGFSQVATQEQVVFVGGVLQDYQSGTITEIQAVQELATIYRTDSQLNKNSSGQYCWCKVTGYRAHGEDTRSVTPSIWTYMIQYDTSNDCLSECATECAESVKGSSMYRAMLFSPDQ